MTEEDMKRERNRRLMYRSLGLPEDISSKLFGRFLRQRLKSMDVELKKIGSYIKKLEKSQKRSKRPKKTRGRKLN
jgi:hypothetical protein